MKFLIPTFYFIFNKKKTQSIFKYILKASSLKKDQTSIYLLTIN